MTRRLTDSQGDLLSRPAHIVGHDRHKREMEQAKVQIAQLEERFESYLTKKARKRFLSSVGPFLLTLTFIEDGLRIFLRWGEQFTYMNNRMGEAEAKPPSPRARIPERPHRARARAHPALSLRQASTTFSPPSSFSSPPLFSSEALRSW